ncbi:MAG: hypothetical protein GY861_20030 [bacterium]|nr:hypothetical protein [bacterium]
MSPEEIKSLRAGNVIAINGRNYVVHNLSENEIMVVGIIRAHPDVLSKDNWKFVADNWNDLEPFSKPIDDLL